MAEGSLTVGNVEQTAEICTDRIEHFLGRSRVLNAGTHRSVPVYFDSVADCAALPEARVASRQPRMNSPAPKR